MSGVKRIEHAVLRVTDLEEAVEFYTDVLGLLELERDDGVVYLGCGLDRNYDVGLTEGATGIDHFAIRLDDEEELAAYRERVEAAGVATERRDGAEPGQDRAVRFSLPSGVDAELVTVEDAGYHHPTESAGERTGVTPRDLDHVNLMTYDVDPDREFLEDVLDFRTSDVIRGESGFTVQAWLRHGEYHHDVGLSTANDVKTTLSHVAFEMAGIDQVKTLVDRLVREGYELELGPSRHNAGSNVFAYFWSPGGNRIEVTAEMATVDDAAEPEVRVVSNEDDTVSSWGGAAPPREFFEQGS